MQKLFSLGAIATLSAAVLVGFSAPAKAGETSTACSTDGEVAACAAVDEHGNAAVSIVDENGNQVTVSEDANGNRTTEVIEQAQ
ncbi:hypothetical protein [Pseudanabaena sp. PCC 6802]|uniref:hypothetical protein n=1 Tax=Pseudanabaena sp. PCC 6802 TaxID=118173 RepID=UPI00034B149B|nr:hypothetical protein [Pseudanabaena sp. PCC 6802]